MAKRTMEELFETLPEIPEGFEENCRKYAMPAPIFYKRRGKYAECVCGFCGRYFTRATEQVQQPSRDIKTSCDICHTDGVYRWMNETRPKYEYFTVVLIQCRTDGNLAVRHFSCNSVYQNGAPHNFKVFEATRYFMDLGDCWKFNNHGNYGGWSTKNAGITYADILYPGSEEEIAKSNLKYFKQGYAGGLIEELKAYARNPALEMFEKMGLKKLKYEIVANEGRSKYINRRGKSMKAQLRLKDRQRINYLISKNGGLRILQILQMEESQNARFTEEEKAWIDVRLSGYGAEKSFRNLLAYMSFRKMYNRMKKYEEQDGAKYEHQKNDVFKRYGDYIEMRAELGYDMTNEVYLFPKNLREKHDEMVEEKNRASNLKYEEEQEEKFQAIRERFEKLYKEYGYHSSGYFIRPAKNATEIIREGRTLHHCVGRESYLQKHNDGKTFILFLRKDDSPEKPYYTIEIRGTEILQWYGMQDRKPDKEIIEPWLKEFVNYLRGAVNVA